MFLVPHPDALVLHQPIVILPLPFITLSVMKYFKNHYADPSNRLTMERAIECDRVSDMHASKSDSLNHVASPGATVRGRRFNKDAYRQPILAERATEPLPYRRGTMDPPTTEAIDQLRQWSHQYENMYRAPEGNADEMLRQTTTSRTPA